MIFQGVPFVLLATVLSHISHNLFSLTLKKLSDPFFCFLKFSYSIGAKSAFVEEFGEEVTTRHCLFHLAQSVVRRVKREGLAVRYGQDAVFKRAIRSLVALAFLRPEEVLPAFATLDERKPDGAEPIYEYFQRSFSSFFDGVFAFRTYVVRLVNGVQHAPPFAPVTWNAHDATIANLQRSNNAVEGWHSAFKKRFTGHHSPFSRLKLFSRLNSKLFYRFILAMKEEVEYQKNRLRPYQIDPTRGIAEKRLKKYVRNDEAIRALVQRYDAVEQKTDQNLIDHLGALQYRLADQGIDNWVA